MSWVSGIQRGASCFTLLAVVMIGGFPFQGLMILCLSKFRLGVLVESIE